ncbi:polysaccharide deacetylase family protein [Sphingobacterium sp. LRF_L2]|uniref:polysaccharide deacetylase family protein n=1 Tax=Sphingobacterium sp. LRF_L2 TaxID=3369421 RepID=UPI003F5E4AEA
MLKHQILFPLFIFFFVIALLLGIFGGSFLWLFIVVVFALLLTIWGSFDIRIGYFVKTFFSKKEPDNKVIALTFDDGPSAFTPAVKELLSKYQMKATFFCIGERVLKDPELVRALSLEGHVIANHTYFHKKNFGFQTQRQVAEEIAQCDSAILQATGKLPKFFRPPFGVTNPSVAKAVKESRHLVIGWSNRSLDTVTSDEDRILKRVKRKLKAGDIILFHDTSQRTVNVLQRLLPYLKEEGYACVSVDDLLNLQAYEISI